MNEYSTLYPAQKVKDHIVCILKSFLQLKQYNMTFMIFIRKCGWNFIRLQCDIIRDGVVDICEE